MRYMNLLYIVISTDLCGSVRQCFDSNLARLEAIWNKMGFTSDEVNGRRSSVTHHLQTLFKDMIDEETEREQKTVDCIKYYQAQIQEISEELGQPQTAKVLYMTLNCLYCFAFSALMPLGGKKCIWSVKSTVRTVFLSHHASMVSACCP